MLFLLPSIILFSVFFSIRLFRTIYLSFFLTNAKGDTTVFVGWQNYVNMFTHRFFLKVLSQYVFVCFIHCSR